jgi:hypothetical protein
VLKLQVVLIHAIGVRPRAERGAQHAACRNTEGRDDLSTFFNSCNVVRLCLKHAACHGKGWHDCEQQNNRNPKKEASKACLVQQ